MRMKSLALWVAAAMTCVPAVAAPAKSAGPAHTNSIKVVSDKVEDWTTIEAILGWMVNSKMSDKEKGLAVWETVVKLRHQNPPPNEFLESEENVHDPVKTANVYGYGMCCCAASNIEALARAAGLQARGRIISHHSVPEVFWDGDWHMLDASLITWFPDDKGDVASVDEIIASVTSWLDKNPTLKGNDAELRKYMRGGGWKKGPAVLAGSKFYDDNGWLPAKSHGWYSTMQEYDGKNKGFYEYGYSMGYRALFKLRKGESLTRNWSNKGLHVNMDSGGVPSAATDKVGEGELRYAPKFGDIAPGRVGNGTLLYRVPLSAKGWRSGAWSLINVKVDVGITPSDKSKGAEAVFRMHCPYVFLTGKVRVAGEKRNDKAMLKVFLSTNNAQDWAEVKAVEGLKFNEEIDIGKKVLRRYDYYVKLAMAGDVKIFGLQFENDIQHSQRALPALAQGQNTITFSAGPAIDTITIAPSLKKNIGENNEALENFHPKFEGARHEGDSIGGSGSLTIPVETPGDIYAVRFGGHFGRAESQGNGVKMLVSFDGRTWQEAGNAPGPYNGFCKYVEFNKAPAGARKVLVRYQLNGASIMSMRVDVDYWDTPDGRPTKSENIAPVLITYVYNEGGEKRQQFVAQKAQSKFTINCASKPEMKSIIVEIPGEK